MLSTINDLIYSTDISQIKGQEEGIIAEFENLAEQAFADCDEQAMLEAHRVLYSIYMANLAVPWVKSPKNINHPLISNIRFKLEEKWELCEIEKVENDLRDLPDVEEFSAWINNYVKEHEKNVIHPIFPYLRDEASYAQLKQFFLQETPLEMLFGDVVALMLPGVYGEIKSEITQNFWDEAGHAKEKQVHRYLRGQIMDYLDIPQNCYIDSPEIFVREELELINTYLFAALNRHKLGELIGILLATELMIPNRFAYQIQGWNRVGVDNSKIQYLTDHISVDAKHAQDWLDLVVKPLLDKHPEMMSDIVVGCAKRLEKAHLVCEKLHAMVA